jgi:hypothetical protein
MRIDTIWSVDSLCNDISVSDNTNINDLHKFSKNARGKNAEFKSGIVFSFLPGEFYLQKTLQRNYI